jgi:LysR family nitrogen assimilation transcriptional regulator
MTPLKALSNSKIFGKVSHSDIPQADGHFLDIKQLRTFLAIAGSGSITRASELLHTVQPALSRQLRMLEEDLGAPLFDRGARGMVLTDAGQILVGRAQRALQELDQAEAEIVAAGQSVSGTVSIGLLPSVSEMLAGPLVRALKLHHPRLTVRLTIGYAGYLQQWLENGEVDVALLYFSKPLPSLKATALVDEKLYVVGLPEAGLRTDVPVKLHELKSLPFIMPSNSYGLRLLLDNACAVAGMQLNIVAETNSMVGQKQLVSHGIGYTILPGGAVFDDVAQGRMSAAPITAPDVSRRIVLAQSLTHSSSLAVRRTVLELRSLIRDLIDRNAWPSATWIDTE